MQRASGKADKSRVGIEKSSKVKKVKGGNAKKVFGKEVVKLAEKYGLEPLFLFSYEKEEGRKPEFKLEVA